MADKIRVVAAPGRTVPIPSNVATAPGNLPLYLKPGEEIEVDPSDTHIVRRLRSGDLIVVDAPIVVEVPTKKTAAAKES